MYVRFEMSIMVVDVLMSLSGVYATSEMGVIGVDVLMVLLDVWVIIKKGDLKTLLTVQQI